MTISIFGNLCCTKLVKENSHPNVLFNNIMQNFDDKMMYFENKDKCIIYISSTKTSKIDNIQFRVSRENVLSKWR